MYLAPNATLAARAFIRLAQFGQPMICWASQMQPKLPEEIQARIERIRRDNTSGAMSLSQKAAGIIAAFVRSTSIIDSSRLLQDLVSVARALIKAQPTMAPIVNLTNTVLWRAETASEPEVIRAVVEKACAEFVNGIDTAGERVSGEAAHLIGNGMTVMTNSHSQTVFNAFTAAHHAGKRFHVICSESRPICEGTAMARELGNAGIQVTLIVDAAMLSLLPRTQLVIVGADSVSNQSVVNKTGTSLLALAAHEKGKDFYALCGSEKFLPATCSLPPEPPKPASEIMAERLDNVTVENFYFDLTPLDFITAVVTEEGILGPEQVRERLGRVKIHPALLDGLGE